LHLLAPQPSDLIGRAVVAFMATIPAVVGIHAVLVVVAIRPIVLLVVSHHIVKGESVMRSNEVHALVSMVGVITIVRKKIVAAIDPAHEIWHHSRIAFDEAPHIIPKPCIPLQPGYAWEPASELISPCVPRFRDQP